VGNCLLEKAQVFKKMNSLEEAVKQQIQAYYLFADIERYSNSDFLTNILINLAEM